MTFTDGIHRSAPFTPARHTGGEMRPSLVVLHDTASSLKPGAAAEYLRDNDAKVSVHFVIERNGVLAQLVPINKAANHAGRSSYHGRNGCNGFSIGIELVNPGRMTRHGPAKAASWFGKTFDRDQYGIEEIQTEAHGRGFWMPYTESQMATLMQLLADLFREVDTLTDITTHWYISPGRKIDTNPLFPLEHIRSRILGRDDPAQDSLDAQAPLLDGGLVQIHSPGDGFLNLRRWPSFNPNVIAQIPHDTILPVTRRGVFDGRDWLCVEYGGREGWISAAYADPIAFKETPA